MRLTFLGTACMKPSKERNPSAVFLEHEGEGLLFDCGEGTQRQFTLFGVKPTKVTRVFISHWHGDHVLGLAGLIATLGASEYTGVLHIYGPRETSKRLRSWLDAVPFDSGITVEAHDVLKGGIILETPSFTIEAQLLKHRLPCLGFVFQESERRKMNVEILTALGIPKGPLWGKLQAGGDVEWKGKKIGAVDVTSIVRGRRVAYITDTLLVDNCYALAENADILVCEAPHASDLADKAKEFMHLTAKEAGQIAHRSSVKQLILQHFSGRYADTSVLASDCREEFKNVMCAHDGMTLEL